MNRYDDLAALFTYPNADGVEHVRAALDRIGGDFGPFAQRVRSDSPETLEEHFTRSFDINPVASLEVGWHLFGEDYSRGSFLVRMRGLMREHGIPEQGELPDHLTSVLAVLGRLKGTAADELATGFALPALTKILASFRDKDNDYEWPLRAVHLYLREQHGEEAVPGEVSAQPYGDACGSCGLLKGVSRE